MDDILFVFLFFISATVLLKLVASFLGAERDGYFSGFISMVAMIAFLIASFIYLPVYVQDSIAFMIIAFVGLSLLNTLILGVPILKGGVYTLSLIGLFVLVPTVLAFFFPDIGITVSFRLI
jgi:hypothetical protein